MKDNNLSRSIADNYDQDIAAWLKKFDQQVSSETIEKLHRALNIFLDHTKGQHPDTDILLRHSKGLVEILASIEMGDDPLIAAFFCNIPTEIIPIEVLNKEFGRDVSGLVEGVRKLHIVDQYKESLDQDISSHLEGLRKLLLAMAQDVRVLFIKLAERVQLMREIKGMSDDVRKRIARETMDIFAPLANRLGIWQLKWELEDLSFRFLEPEDYQRIAGLLDEKRADREEYIARVIGILKQELEQVDIKGEVAGRPKHIYSIWKKMTNKNVDFHNLFDVRAVRVLVDDIASCYAVLGIVHSLWRPLKKEFDDYIASPKENMYQSLHTAVIGPEGKTLEIQIRTYDMHRHSEHGLAAHWGYKEGFAQNNVYREKIAWLRQILEWRDEETGSEDFIDRFKSELFQDRVYVFTPKGRVVDLPRGATPLDFAYHIHTDIGHGFRGAKVDGKIVPIRYELKNGEQVEILASKTKQPSRDWLNPNSGYLKSSRARAKVRTWFKQQEFANNVADGRQVVDRELHRLGVSSFNQEQLAQRFNYPGLDEFFAAVGCGDVTSAQIAGRLKDQVLPDDSEQILPLPARRRRKKSTADSGIRIMGVGDLMTHLANCCKPVPYDQIMGYITRGRGVTIHRSDCPNVLRLQKAERDRVIQVEWSDHTDYTYSVDIHVRAFDRQGLLRDITDVLTNDHLNVTAVNTNTDKKTHIADMTLTIDVSDVSQLSRALVKIEQLTNVLEASRKH